MKVLHLTGNTPYYGVSVTDLEGRGLKIYENRRGIVEFEGKAPKFS